MEDKMVDFLDDRFISQKNIEDETENEDDIEDVQSLNFSDMAITGTDWTVETIANQISHGNIDLNPSFQRRNAWSNKFKSKFIESLFLGLPIPQIILAEKKDKRGQFIVIDGKQRLLSLQQFFTSSDNKNSFKISGLEILSKFNHMSYNDIQMKGFYDDINAFNNQTIRTVVIRKWKDVRELYLLFLRLNTGSVKLSPQELRQALYPGAFIEFINEQSGVNKKLQKMLNINKPDFRMRDVEIFIRYFAFYFFAKEYRGSMQRFLDYTCKHLNEKYERESSTIVAAVEKFNISVDLVNDVFGENAFKKYKNGKYESRYNRAVIDIMLYYFSKDLDTEMIKKKKKEIKEGFEKLCNKDTNFVSSLEVSTKSRDSISYRFGTWANFLSNILDVTLISPYSI